MSVTFAEAANQVLRIADPVEKSRHSQALAAPFLETKTGALGAADLPERPSKLDNPPLVAPREVKRRKLTSQAGRIALLHALAHIELNAVNLSWDIVGRFSDWEMPTEFYIDWIKVANDESKHFLMLQGRLEAMGASYGDLPAHDGLWESAIRTSKDLLARLAVVPMVLEARGLDVTPMMIEKLTELGDMETVDCLKIIYEDEITHVFAGKVWFEFLAKREGHTDLETCWQELVKEHFTGSVKRPFNVEGREEAEFQQDYYEPLADWYEATDFNT